MDRHQNRPDHPRNENGPDRCDGFRGAALRAGHRSAPAKTLRIIPRQTFSRSCSVSPLDFRWDSCGVLMRTVAMAVEKVYYSERLRQMIGPWSLITLRDAMRNQDAGDCPLQEPASFDWEGRAPASPKYHGLAGARPSEKWFMVPKRDRSTVAAFHEPA